MSHCKNPFKTDLNLFQVSYDTVKTLRGVVGNVLKAQSIETLGGRGGGGGSKGYKTNLEQSLNSASSSSLTSGSDQPKPEPKFTLYIQSGAPQRQVLNTDIVKQRRPW